MKLFQRTFFLVFFIIYFLNLTYPSQDLIETISSGKNELLFENKKAPISDQTIREIKKSQILLLIIITFFVSGFLFLIYHLKKIRIINLKLEEYSRENDFLIRETNHRVNNNLQLISILISDTLKKNISAESKNDFIRLLSKVETIALLHRHLYTSKSKNEIDLNNYLIDVLDNFDEIFLEKNISIKYEIDELHIDSDTAMYLGLLITELIINSIKHAFEENQTKEVLLGILDLDESIKFVYQDNGEKPKEKIVKPKLIDQLCLQLEADYEIDISKGFKLTFNINKHD